MCQPAKRLAVFVGTAVGAVPLNSDLDIRTTHGQAKSLRAPRLVHCGSRHDGLHLPTLSASSHFFRHDKPIHLPKSLPESSPPQGSVEKCARFVR